MKAKMSKRILLAVALVIALLVAGTAITVFAENTVDVKLYGGDTELAAIKDAEGEVTKTEDLIISKASNEITEADALYSVTDKDENVTYYDSDVLLSTVITNATAGSTITLYGDATVNTNIDVYNNISIDLNDWTLSTDGGKLQCRNATLKVYNGDVKITNNELVYVGEGYANSRVDITDVDVIRCGDVANKMLTDVRGGTTTLDTVRVTAENWSSGTEALVSGGYRTNAVSREINIVIKNSTIDLSKTNSNLFNLKGQADEKNGWKGVLTVSNSSITVAKYMVQATPASNSAENCGLDISFDGTSTLCTGSFFNVDAAIPTEKISVAFEVGAKVSSVPTLPGVDISYSGGGCVYDIEGKLFTVADEAYIAENCGSKLVDNDGNVYLYVAGTDFTKEYVAFVQETNCTVVFLKDMKVPAGTSTSDLYTITPKTLTVDLNKHTLTISDYAQFTTEKDVATVITFRNGTIHHFYQVFYSYHGDANVVSFKAEDVQFISDTSIACFDHRIGTLTLINCEYQFNKKDNSSQYVFKVGDVADTKSVKVYLTGCKIDTTSTGDRRSIFNLYNGRNVEVKATDCRFYVGGSAYIVNSTDDRKKNLTNTINFTNCELNKKAENAALFNLVYDVDITLDETYVSCGSSIEEGNGDVVLADGQRIIGVKEGGYMVTKPSVKLKANLSLYVDFTLNLWLPTDTAATLITVGENVYTLSEMPVLDGLYRVSIGSISANSAADGVELVITYKNGERTLEYTVTYSVIDYVKAVLELDSYSAELKSLLVNIADYVTAVYIYDGKEVPSALAELLESDAYLAASADETNDKITVIPDSETDINTATAAISGAMLSLDNSMRFTFNLNPEYSGSLVLVCGDVRYECEVVDGKVNGESFIEIGIKACNLYDEVIYITAGENNGSYDLAAYIEGTKDYYEANEKLETLLLDLYNYCKEASEYKAYVALNGGVMG